MANIRDIYWFIWWDSPFYAEKTVKEIYNMISFLEISPYMGRYIPELYPSKRFRELIYKKHYRIIYYVSKKEQTIYVLKILHSSQKLDLNFNPKDFI